MLLFDTEFADTVSDLASREGGSTAVKHWLQVGSDDCANFAQSYSELVDAGSDQEPETLNPYAPGGDSWITREIAGAWSSRRTFVVLRVCPSWLTVVL